MIFVKKNKLHKLSHCMTLLTLLFVASNAFATDLFLEGYTPCEDYQSHMGFFKIIANNTSAEGGGPFDSDETIVEVEQTPMEMNGAEIGVISGQLFWSEGQMEMRTYQGVGAKMDPPPGDCVVNGRRITCNLGSLPAGEVRTLRLYYVATSPGDLTLQIRGRGNLFDPNPTNNVFQSNLTILPQNFRLVYPWVSNNEGQFESILVANNFGESEASITLTARRSDGSQETVQRVIPIHGSLIERASSLFPQLGSGSGYCVTLESKERQLSGHWVTNNLVTGSGRSPSQGVAIDNLDINDPYSDHFGRNIMFGYLPVQGDLTSAPVIVNLGNRSADVVLRFYDGAGTLILEDRDTLRDLAPLRPFAAVANTLVPQNSEDLYLVASSDQQLTGVAFVFNSLGEPAIGNAVGIARFEP